MNKDEILEIFPETPVGTTLEVVVLVCMGIVTVEGLCVADFELLVCFSDRSAVVLESPVVAVLAEIAACLSGKEEEGAARWTVGEVCVVGDAHGGKVVEQAEYLVIAEPRCLGLFYDFCNLLWELWGDSDGLCHSGSL
jgi:hypothetical protein